MILKFLFYITLFLFTTACQCAVDARERQVIPLNSDWKTIKNVSNDTTNNTEYIQVVYNDASWKQVDVPHNWDQYEGYRRMKHGNLHGTAWYRKTFSVTGQAAGKHYFLFFEGVGSYATVWVNGVKVGTHQGGRTTFTLDITGAVNLADDNVITVRADHPAFIANLPWVCGGCSGEWGFSEGSQPMGIFRPVSLLITNAVKIEPFGVHIWNDSTTSAASATLNVETEIKNYAENSKAITVVSRLLDARGEIVAHASETIVLKDADVKKVKQQLPDITAPKLWSPENPHLYTLITTLEQEGGVIDQLETPYGIRWISWPVGRDGGDQRFFINGEPYFINGTCEYEHLMGKSHAFTHQMIKSRCQQMMAGGFNAFREAHQPHNLEYQKIWDSHGILFWSQFSAHIWYDTPAFKENFKKLLRDWIRERRNSPSVVLWGLQNESTIPEEFARECTAIIREMDPTTSAQRKVVTCNGGTGTDWNVIQNWSGTYGGDPYNYGNELSKDLLNGEYGAWRTAGLHTEGDFDQKGIYSENRFSQLMEIKVREAEAVKDQVAGQFNWLFSSHENPGRIQNGEAFRDMDRVGPVNYKGLFTAWGEPVDAFYMYRANYAPKETNPMVYIVSHSWPERWREAGTKDQLVVYSNCDEVALFNDIDGAPLGRKKNPGIGKHFQWDGVYIKYNVIVAKGYVAGKQVAQDVIVLNNLPEAPHFNRLKTNNEEVLKPQKNLKYIYRVNAGGEKFVDNFNNTWAADIHKTQPHTWGSRSWTDGFDSLPAFYASQRTVHDPIKNTSNWPLFQHFRYGMDQLQYEFPVPDGKYTIELYFIEPWYGTGGGMNCKGWRNFDIAINDSTVLKDFDIWKEAGHDSAIKKTFQVQIDGGLLKVSFPRQASGEAVISAIAIASEDHAKGAMSSPLDIQKVNINAGYEGMVEVATWMDAGQPRAMDATEKWSALPYQLYGAQWLRFSDFLADKPLSGTFKVRKASQIYVIMEAAIPELPGWLESCQKIEEDAITNNSVRYNVYQKKVGKGKVVDFKENGEAASIYAIVVIPDYSMGEGEETRPVYKLEAGEAGIQGKGVQKGNFKKSDYITFEGAGPNSITWQVSPGLAGIHLLRFRYMNSNATAMKVRFEIIAANGIIMRDDTIEFPKASEKWRILNTTTGGYINAGTYDIRISGNNLRGLRLESFEFQ